MLRPGQVAATGVWDAHGPWRSSAIVYWLDGFFGTIAGVVNWLASDGCRNNTMHYYRHVLSGSW
jgi:hypothetical protein